KSTAVNLIQTLWFDKLANRLRVTGEIVLPVGFLFLLAKQYRAMEGGLAACRIAKRFCNPIKKPRRDFLWAGNLRGIGGAAAGGCEAMEGVGAPGTPQSP
ncbi:MAG: hypothetical protein II397_03950, partial [Treponema sp.]|nr:hypothetical protein [Treponema sp.]